MRDKDFSWYSFIKIFLWISRNPQKDFNETIPTKIFISHKKREIELCFFCYENELDFCNNNNISFKKILDDRFETLNLLKLV